MMIHLIRLTENDKRILIAVFLIVILAFLLIGLIASLIRRFMTNAGKDVDTYMYNVVTAQVVTTPRQFRKIGRIKNFQKLYKTIRFPFVLLVIAFGLIIFRSLYTNNHFFTTYFSNDTGVGALFYQWDFRNAEKASLLGIPTFIPLNWPDLINEPHFNGDLASILAYASFLPLILGLLLYIKHLVAFIARSLRTRKLSKTIFQKTLTPPPSL